MKRIFISYARSDQAFARQLANKLESIGTDVWIDLDDIIAGEKWSSAIQEGLDSSDGMVVILSPDSMASTNVEDEWQYFMDHGNPVIPLLLKPAKVHFQLNRLQYVDFHTQDFDPAFADLLQELRSKGIALDGRTDTAQPIAPLQSATKPKMTSPATVAEKAQAATLAKPVWQQTPIIIGAVVALIAIVGFSIWYAIPNSPDTFAFIEEEFIIEEDSWQVHEDPNGSSQLVDFGESEILQRFISNDDIWYTVVDTEMDVAGFQIATEIPVDNVNLLNVIPIEVTILDEIIELFDRPYTSDNSIDADVVGVSYLYGIFRDPDDNIWYYVSVFEDDEGRAVNTGWVRTDQLLVDEEFQLIPLIYSTENIRIDSGTIRVDDLLWLISVDVNATEYEVAYYDRDLAQWRLVFIDTDDLEVDDITQSQIPYRGN